MQTISYRPIGVIHSPFRDVKGMPIQPAGAEDILGSVDIEPDYAAGLKDIEGFSHIILIYHFHLAEAYSLEVKPFLDDELHGIFATRAPRRPNAIGISIVRLMTVEGSVIHVADVDVVDGTPLLDLKPYVPEFDVRRTERIGWLSKAKRLVRDVKADERFRRSSRFMAL
jgi:tRNA-Thr(GGU) m(6)t(6)A37 methyltransferase TsaA